ncbi:MAG: MoaD/ThiS family protein [Gordonia sp. (in: high G+C Gram-positive bacteria)]
MELTIRFFAAARAAAGVETATVVVDDTATLGDLEARLGALGPELSRVLPRCSYLCDAIARCDRATRLGPTRMVDVLPPFAGG